jgi:zinc and cadmium transporter
MNHTWLFTFISVLIVSTISLVGIFFVSLKEEVLKKILLLLVSFSAGALMGDAFLHLLPEAVASAGFSLAVSLSIILGIAVFFVLEKIIFWRHCHVLTSEAHPHPFAYMNLVGDSFHNFIDGMIIAGSFLASVPLGISTTLAVIAHEIPQEIGDFGVLLHGGFTRPKALFLNFLTALTAFAGASLILILSLKVEVVTSYLVPFTAGGFIYIAGSDLIPELKKHVSLKDSALQLLFMLFGVLVMIVLL